MIAERGPAWPSSLARRAEALQHSRSRSRVERAESARGPRRRRLARSRRHHARGAALADATEGAFDPTVARCCSAGGARRRGAVLTAASPWRVRGRPGGLGGPSRSGGTRTGSRGVASPSISPPSARAWPWDEIARGAREAGCERGAESRESSLRAVGTPPPAGWRVLLRHPCLAASRARSSFATAGASTSATDGHARESAPG